VLDETRKSPIASPDVLNAGPDDGGQVSLFTLLRLRKDTAMPLYQQIEEQIAAMIANGRIDGGATLPAERQLAEVLGVSRATVQQSYGRLRDRKLIRGHGRHGSIVQASAGERLSPGMDRLKGFTQEMRDLGREPSARIIEHEVVSDRSIASLFELPSSAQFLRLVRVRSGDGVPLALESAWYSLDAAPAVANYDPHASIYAQLLRDGLPLAYCDQAIEATMPNPFECEIFGFKTPVPSLLIKRRSYTRAGVMVEYVEGMFRGDAYTYRLRLDA
jgi:GntR family transcriptional regulator